MGKRKLETASRAPEEQSAKRAKKQNDASNNSKPLNNQASLPTPSTQFAKTADETAIGAEMSTNPKTVEAQKDSSGDVERVKIRRKRKTNKVKREKKAKQCPVHTGGSHSADQCTTLHPELSADFIAHKADKKKAKLEKKIAKNEERNERLSQNKAAEKEAAVKDEKTLDENIKAPKKEKRKTRKIRRLEAERNKEVSIVKKGDDTGLDVKDGPTKQSSSNWNISKPAGGRFLEHDPIFNVDEKYLFLATRRAVHVYSTSTSLLVRTFTTNPLESVAGYALSVVDPDHLYIANESGSMILWNWDIGREVLAVRARRPTRAIAVVQLHGTDCDTVFTIETEQQPNRQPTSHIVARQFTNNSTSVTPYSIWFHREPLLSLKLLDGGNVIFAASANRMILGNLSKKALRSFDKLNTVTMMDRYMWRDQEANEPMTCFDAMVRPRAPGQADKTNKLSLAMYDLVCGGVQGNIYVYEDFLRKTEWRDTNSTTAKALAPRVMHWHREAVRSVKWSLDGNYIISGGKETVLCLWQLETGKRQNLPHLASAINAITVSPRGTSYAVQLADNSVMVLSTTELQPKTNIPSIQSLFVSPLPSLRPTVETLSSLRPDSDDPVDVFGRTPATANPRIPNQLLLAVPASQEGSQENNTPASAPFLQTFDVFTCRHVSRQALTRNNATSRNSGPDGNKINEPNTVHLKISEDGKWLASVEEWVPPTKDVEITVYETDGALSERKRRMETYLKFWSWHSKQENWVLETRMDFPHQSATDPFANKVFDLISHPTSSAFATIGEDGLVRTWRPKTRKRDGTVVRGAGLEGVISWSCTHTIELERVPSQLEEGDDFPASPAPTNGRITYSNDGSILAAALENPDADESGLVHFIDPSTGIVKNSEASMYNTDLAGMAFLGRHFIILSEAIRVWDIVTNRLIYGINLRMPVRLRIDQVTKMSHLAVNMTSNTFAIAVPTTTDLDLEVRIDDLRSTVTILDATQPEALTYYDTPSPVTALVPLAGQAGFVVIDSSAEFRILSPKASGTFIASAPMADSSLSLTNGQADEVEDIEMEEEEDAEVGAEREKEDSSDEDDMMGRLDNEKAVVRPEQLAGVFDRGPSFALPSVNNLFASVAGLYGKKAQPAVRALS